MRWAQMRAGLVLSQYEDDWDDGGDDRDAKDAKEEKKEGSDGNGSSSHLTIMDVERLIRRNGECLRLSTTLWSLLLLLLRLVGDMRGGRCLQLTTLH